MRFLLECLSDLDAGLRKLGTRLYIIHGQPEEVFPRLFEVSSIDRNQMSKNVLQHPYLLSKNTLGLPELNIFFLITKRSPAYETKKLGLICSTFRCET